ncbi:cytochrome c biogenesis protein [archaeon]|nr:cytochrome c biogenesis protein [archaeon]
MKISKILLVILILLSFNASMVNAEDQINLHIFYGQGCPHCAAAMSALDYFQEKYSNLNVHKHEIYFNNDERALFEKVASAYGEEIQGVPTLYIGEEVFIGFSNQIKEEIAQTIEACQSNSCIDPVDKIEENNDIIQSITIPAVISAAVVDSINPCAFAVLIILVSTILTSKNRKKALLAGIAFTLAIFTSYLLMGVGLYSAIQATGINHTFYWIVAILAIFIGLFNLKDYLWYGRGFLMEVPLSWRPKMKSIIKSVTSVPGAFLVGFIVSLFLLPCTSGPYIVILGLLAKAATKSYAFILLVLYNLIFILPMLIITLAIFFGFTTTEKAEELRQKKLKVLHLIAGIIILLLGIGMIIAINLGMI